MTIEEFVDKIQIILPFEAGFEDDRLGIQVRIDGQKVERVLICYELTQEVIKEAKEKQADLIVSFHPLIYYPLLKIESSERVGFLVQELIRNSISLIVCHTNFDAYRKGTSWIFGSKIGLKINDFLEKNSKIENFGFGVVGEYNPSIEKVDFLSRIAQITFSPLRWCEGRVERIKKVAIVAGSGMSFAELAFQRNVDAFITADISYHNFHKYNGKMMLVDPGHWEMEYFVGESMKTLFEKAFNSELLFFVSTTYTNPIKYFADKNYNELQKKELLDKSKEK